MMEFLYFPEDKTEYIPAVIVLIIFMLGAAAVMYWFYKTSQKEAEAIEKKYQQHEAGKHDNGSSD